jgi:hypothetical protein
MSAISDYLENALQDWYWRNVSFTPPGTAYLTLYTSAPSDSGGGTEVSAGGYARLAVIQGTAAWNASSAGTVTNVSTLVVGTASADWGTVTALSFMDTASGTGNLQWWGTLTASKVVQSGDIFQFAAGSLAIGLQ